MTREEVKNTVNGFLVEDLEIEENKLREDALLKEDVGIDSLDFVDIVVLVEEKFGIKIKAEEMAGVKTLGAFYDYVESRLEVSGK
ncbi:MAG: acyl carrier protein [Bacteroidales bacterium]|nr:acyl carrier protein [Candidatus Cacconaster caballi]